MRKSFTIDPPRTDKIEFEITGFDVQGRPVPPTLFKCKDQIQGRAVTDMLQKVESGESAAAGEIISFIEMCLDGQGEIDRFKAITESDDVIVSIDMLGEIMQWLIGEFAGGRPTSTPSALQGGSSVPGATPMVQSHSQQVPSPQNYPWQASSTPSMP